MANSKLTCKACKIKVPRHIIIENNGFCDGCITHTKPCDCGCGEEIFSYIKNGNLAQYVSQAHRNKAMNEQMRQRTIDDPEYAARISKTRSDAASKMYKDRPELKQARRAETKKRYENPEERKKTSKKAKEYWSDPEHREEQSQRQLDFIEDNPEITELRTKASKDYWSDEESRDKKSEEVQTLWQDDEFREKQHQARLGNTNAKGNKGKPKSEEHRQKIGDAHRGKKLSPEHVEKMRLSKLGAKREILICVACGEGLPRDEITHNDGFCHDCITHTKLCDCGCGEETFSYRKNGKLRGYVNYSHHSLHLWQDEEHRKMMQEMPRASGDENANWRGGTSFDPYDKAFTLEFKETIRIRQNRICADIDDSCIHPEGIKLDVHHIDGNKKNSVPENCIALCRSHHGRILANVEAQIRHKTFIESL